MTSNSAESIQDILKRWILRQRLQNAIRNATFGFAAGSAAALAYLIYALASGSILSSEFLRFAAFAPAIAALLGISSAYAWPMPLQPAARQFDQAFDLKERVSTALEIAGGSKNSSLQSLQFNDTLKAAAHVNLQEDFPLKLPRLALVLLVFFSAANIALYFYGDSIFLRAENKRQTQALIQAQADQIENLIESINQNDELTENQKEALTTPLAESLDKVNQSETLEEAFSALEEAQEQLKSLQDPSMDALAEQFNNIGEELAESDSDTLSSLGEQLSSGDLNKAAQSLAELGSDTLSPEDLAELGTSLDSLADAVMGENPDLAAQLRKAANAAQQGDQGALQEALEQAAESLEGLDQQMTGSQAAEQISEQLGENQNQLVTAGQQGQDGNPAAGTPGGQGSGTENEASGAGSGAGDGSGNQDNASGSVAGTAPVDQGNNPDGGGETVFQPISASSLSGEGGDWIAVPPSGLEGDNITGVGPTDPGSIAPITVPYSEVFPQYQQSANQAIDSGFIPPQYRDLIRSYFSSLEP